MGYLILGFALFGLIYFLILFINNLLDIRQKGEQDWEERIRMSKMFGESISTKKNTDTKNPSHNLLPYTRYQERRQDHPCREVFF